jgi:hypothetical protein
MVHKPYSQDQVARLRRELKSGKWLPNAQGRAQRRKTAWNLLLPLFAIPLWIAFVWLLVAGAWTAHLAFHPGLVGAERQFPTLVTSVTALMLFPSFCAALCPALVVSNFLVYLIPPARRAMDKEDQGFRGVDYVSSQSALIKVGAYILGVAVVLGLLGALLR